MRNGELREQLPFTEWQVVISNIRFSIRVAMTFGLFALVVGSMEFGIKLGIVCSVGMMIILLPVIVFVALFSSGFYSLNRPTAWISHRRFCSKGIAGQNHAGWRFDDCRWKSGRMNDTNAVWGGSAPNVPCFIVMNRETRSRLLVPVGVSGEFHDVWLDLFALVGIRNAEDESEEPSQTKTN